MRRKRQSLITTRNTQTVQTAHADTQPVFSARLAPGPFLQTLSLPLSHGRQTESLPTAQPNPTQSSRPNLTHSSPTHHLTKTNLSPTPPPIAEPNPDPDRQAHLYAISERAFALRVSSGGARPQPPRTVQSVQAGPPSRCASAALRSTRNPRTGSLARLRL